MDELVGAAALNAVRPTGRRWFSNLFGLFGWFVVASWVYLLLFVLAGNVIPRPIPDIWLVVYGCSAILAIWGSGLWLPVAIVFIVVRGFRAGTKAEKIQLLTLPTVIAICVGLAVLIAD